MKFLRTVDIRLVSIVLTDGPNGEWRKGLDEGLVEKMVTDIKAGDGASIGPLGVDRQKRLWWGHNRYEAFQRAGVRTVRCEVYQFKDEAEAQAAAIRENLRRKHLSTERIRDLTHELVAIAQKRLVSERMSGPDLATSVAETPEATTPLGGRPKSTRAEAVRRIAKQEKVTRQAIEKRMSPPPADPTPPPANRDGMPFAFRAFGLPVPTTIRDGATGAWTVLSEMDRMLRQVQAKATALQDAPGFDETLARDIRQRIHDVAHLVRKQMPAALCPWCKGQPDVSDNACGQHRGWVGAGVMGGDIPAQLLLEGEQAHVAVNGEYVPLATRAHRNGHGS